MKNSECVLQFMNYSVDKIIFQKNNTYDKEEAELNVKFEHNIREDDENKGNYYINLTMNLFNEEETDYKDCPFKLEISMTGLFKLQDSESVANEVKGKLLNENTLAILFPYMRSLITSVTANANISPLILPPINIIAMLKSEEKDSEKEAIPMK